MTAAESRAQPGGLLERGDLIGGRYRVEGPIGLGAMGVVYAAADTELGRGVALKVLPAHRYNDPTAVERFMRQARAMARIEHHGTVRVYDRGLHDNLVPYVVMERLNGRDLHHTLRAFGRFPPTRAIEIAIELCDAVDAVHRQGVIHRDLKPGNVFLVESHNTVRVKLLDFGIAQVAAESSLTGSADVLGTLPYLAPELLDCAKHAGISSDLYAVACIVYEMLVGHAAQRADSRAELLAVIQRDAPPGLAGRVTSIPPELEVVLMRNLEKDPTARQGSVREFGDSLRRLRPLLTREEPAPRTSAVLEHAGLLANRFRLVAQLGEGSFGTVFEAIDESSGQRIALKLLRFHRSSDLFRFKREFRTASEIIHPNLVRLHALWIEDEHAFFTMELVEGSDAMRYLRRSPERLVDVFLQLAVVLAELHRHGFVHRDLKPDNALVDAAGRVVLLDFGLTVPDGDKSQLGGSLPYMAEEALDGQIAAAGDLYALGVMLHEALTGQRPSAAARAAGAALAPAPEDAPSELWDLCAGLMAREADARPCAEEVVTRLSAYAERCGTSAPRGGQQPAWDSRGSASPFVGREREKAFLRAALTRTAHGTPSIVVIRGQSGLGKTALLAELSREFSSSALCLSSRAREGERLPFPALDAAIDALTEHLCSLPNAILEPLLPRHAHAIAHLFPVMHRIESLEDRGVQNPLPRDPTLVRTLAFGALRRLLRRLTERRPLLWIVDDVQWIDPDSVTLLAHVLSGPEPPALLFVAGLRTDALPNQPLEAMMASLGSRIEQLELAPLDREESTALVRALADDELAQSDLTLQRILEEALGNPLFLATLVAHAAERDAFSKDVSLEAALRARLPNATDPARRLLELAAICTRPLPVELLERVVDDVNADARSLRRARLARRVKVAGREAIEPYHARVREAVLASMSPEAQIERHRCLVEVLAPHAATFPEALIEHLAGAGEGAKAAELAVRSAAAAERQLAFERAAALYAIALTHGDPPTEVRASLLKRQASALRNAGSSVDAAFALERASRLGFELGLDTDARNTLRDAGELLLLAGRIEEGVRLLQPMLDDAALVLEASAAAAIATGLAAFERLARRGLSPAACSTPPTAPELERIDLCLSLANGLALIDLRGLPFAVLGLELALELSDADRLQKTSAAFVTLTAGLFFNPLIEPALELCRKLTASVGTPYARALLHLAEGEAAHFSGRFLVAEAAFERVERILLESCIGANRELAAVRNGSALIEYAQKGDFRSQLARTLTWQTDAEARQDTFHENVLRVAHSIVWIAQDDPERARAELTRAKQQWRQGAGAYELGMLEFWDIIDRYEGDATAHLHPLQGRDDLIGSSAASAPFLAGYVHVQRAWGAIRILASTDHDAGEREMAKQAIAAMRALRPKLWHAFADAYQANVSYLGGRRERALALLERAERGFRRLHARCLAACARMRHGELAGGAFGARLTREADAELTLLGVVRPDRWSRAYFSLFDPDRLGILTLVTETRKRPVDEPET